MATAVKPQRIAIVDLTIDQCEAIEIASGIPLEEWTTPKGRLRSFKHIYAIATGTPPEQVGKMTLRQLTDAITDEDPLPDPP